MTKDITIRIQSPTESERQTINLLTPAERKSVLVSAGNAKMRRLQEDTMKCRKLDSWGSTADEWAWTVLGRGLRQQVVDAVGEAWAVGIQFGNVLGQLRSVGRSDLALQIVDAIDAFNQEQDDNQRISERKKELRKKGYDDDEIESVLDREGYNVP